MDIEIVDLHMHVVPNFDDGSTSIEESIEMLKMSISQGVTDVFCTSHNGYTVEDGKEYRKQLALLQERVKKEKLNVVLHCGCEILTAEDYVEDVLYGIEIGAFSRLGNSKYVLIEFYPDTKPSEATEIVQKVIEKGYNPIIAHMERNYNLSDLMVGLLVRMGAYIQVNAISFSDDAPYDIRNRARKLLEEKYVHFIGSDSHQIKHRPPKLTSGIEYILANSGKMYAEEILSGNAKQLILGER